MSKVILFVSSTSIACRNVIGLVTNNNLPINIVRLDTAEDRASAANGKYFQIRAVPSMVVSNNAGSIQVFVGNDKIAAWISQTTAPPPMRPQRPTRPNQKSQPPPLKMITAGIRRPDGVVEHDGVDEEEVDTEPVDQDPDQNLEDQDPEEDQEQDLEEESAPIPKRRLKKQVRLPKGIYHSKKPVVNPGGLSTMELAKQMETRWKSQQQKGKDYPTQ